jgi:hypothetical protein
MEHHTVKERRQEGVNSMNAYPTAQIRARRRSWLSFALFASAATAATGIALQIVTTAPAAPSLPAIDSSCSGPDCLNNHNQVLL